MEQYAQAGDYFRKAGMVYENNPASLSNTVNMTR